MSKKLKNKEVKTKGKIRKSDLAYLLSVVPSNHLPVGADVIFSKKGQKLVLKGKNRIIKELGLQSTKTLSVA